MAEFTSETKTIPHTDKNIYEALSDMRNLDKIKDKIPQYAEKEFVCDQDSCSISVDPVGSIKFNIVERKPNFFIKFEAEKVPFPLSFWVKLDATAEKETQMKLTVNADVNSFLKPMVSKPLQEAVDKLAEMLASVPFDQAFDTENNA